MGDFTPEDSLKLLGVTYDRHLNFLKHIKNITNNCSALVAEMTKYSAKDLHLPKSYLKDILSQVILPKLFYSILTWSQTKIKIIPYFTPIYNRVCRIITRCPLSTSLPLLYSLSNLPTPSQMFDHISMQKAIILHYQTHSNITNPEIKAKLNKTFSNLRKNQIDLPPTKPLPIPMVHPAVKSDNNVIFHFNNFIDSKETDIFFFTDGSSFDQGKGGVGAGGVGFSGIYFHTPPDWNFSQPITPSANNFEAEYSAVLIVLNSITHKLKLATNPNIPYYHISFTILPSQHIHIYIDNLPVLQNIKHPFAAQNFLPFYTLWKLKESIPNKITFHHIPAHKGHVGNELADAQAKLGAKNHRSTPLLEPIKTPTKSEPKKILKFSYHSTLVKNWKAVHEERALVRSLFDSFTDFQKFLKTTTTLGYINELVAERLATGQYLFKTGKRTSPSCSMCAIIESSQHMLLECPKYIQQRARFLKNAGSNFKTLREIFKSSSYEPLSALNNLIKDIFYPQKILKSIATENSTLRIDCSLIC
jgi:ribonuclease HI